MRGREGCACVRVEGRRQVAARHAPPAFAPREGERGKQRSLETAGPTRKEFSASGSRTMAQLGLQASSRVAKSRR